MSICDVMIFNKIFKLFSYFIYLYLFIISKYFQYKFSNNYSFFFISELFNIFFGVIGIFRLLIWIFLIIVRIFFTIWLVRLLFWILFFSNSNIMMYMLNISIISFILFCCIFVYKIISISLLQNILNNVKIFRVFKFVNIFLWF